MSDPRSPSFPSATPHGPIVPVAEDVYLVRGTFRMGPGLTISRTMTILRAGGELTLVNSIRLSEAGEAELALLGPVRHVVKLAQGHGLDDPYSVARFSAKFWSLPEAKHPGLERGGVLGPDGPIPGGRVVVVDRGGQPEALLWVPQGGGTLVACDVIQNHVDLEGASLLARLMTPLLGFRGGVINASMWRKIHELGPAEVARELAPLGELKFRTLVTGHGPAVTAGAEEAVARLLRG